MGSVIFIIIIVIAVVVSLNKTKTEQSQKQDRKPASQSASGNYTYRSNDSYGQKSSMQTRAGAASAAAAKRAAEHAKDNMSAEEWKHRPSAEKLREMADIDATDGAILSAAKMHNVATELSNEFDSKEDLMEPVWDLMVKGPDTSVPNERDFVSEGMDMINTYTLDS